MKSPNAIVVLQDALVRRRDFELEFLPAALEIVETPASPAGRAIGATIILVFCVALAWASWSTVDIVASAPGKIIPSGRTKVVQPFEIGVVRAIRVRDGQIVRAGDVLIELDPTINDAEREHSRSDLVAAQLEVARLRAALATGSDPLASFEPPDGASPALVATQRQFLLDQTAEQRAKLAALERQQGQKEAERATSAAMINKIERLIPVLQQQLEIRKTLFEHETGSKVNYLQAMQALVEQQQELEVQRSRQREAESAVAAIEETRAQAVAEYRRMRYDDLTKAEQKAAGLAQDVVKAQKRAALQLITAPVDGVVQQLSVHTVGGIVTPAQPLLLVVPAESRLEIEAMVSNRDIGFVQVGQEAEIKVQTFNFTRYGLLRGQVLTVSQDAVGRDPAQSPDKPQGADTRTGGTSESPDPVYAARISLDRSVMQIEDKLVSLSPGMAVTVEIKTGSRSVISYLLSPLRKYKQESLRER
jgi:membrane fusion protein, hemolysin D